MNDLQCVFCGGIDLTPYEDSWYGCNECTASLRYDEENEEVIDHDEPEDLSQVSDLLHEMRKYYFYVVG